MFGIGWTEMLVLGVVALIVIGPKDLPVLMNRLGKAVSAIRRMGTEFQREINKTTGLDQITDLRRSITEPLKQTQQTARRGWRGSVRRDQAKGSHGRERRGRDP
jgi:sec-independent protein translocase protein TatB